MIALRIKQIDVKGTSRECGRELGRIWRDTLRSVMQASAERPQWWRQRELAKLVRKHVPHLPDLYEGFAEGSKIDPRKLVIPTPADLFNGCTSFAVEASATLNHRLLCGQTKDNPMSRMKFLQMLKMEPTDAPSLLTFTYPGVLFGHGFAEGGCAVFRNSLYAGMQSDKLLPYDVWGLLTTHCKTVDAAIDLVETYGVNEPFHCTVSDAKGKVVGIEHGTGGTSVLHPKRGIYAHANNVRGGEKLKRHERAPRDFIRSSKCRGEVLAQNLLRQSPRLTPHLAFAAMASHENYPRGVCNHESDEFCTGAAIVAEPASGRLWVTPGPPCEHWPIEFSLTGAPALPATGQS